MRTLVPPVNAWSRYTLSRVGPSQLLTTHVTNPDQILLTAQELSDFAQWSATVWLTPRESLTLRDHAVMALGLAGESGEVATALQDSALAKMALPALHKELGDALYYCARIANVFALTLPSMGVQVPLALPAFGQVPLNAAALFIAAGRVSERVKKLLRDGVLPENEATFKEALTQELCAYVRAWLGIVACTPWAPQGVLEGNRQKLEYRKARGVLRGSGDDR